MAWPAPTVDFERLANGVLSQTEAVRGAFVDWRNLIANSGGPTTSVVTGMLTGDNYQLMAGYRNFMIASIALGPVPLRDALARKSAAFAGLDLNTAWASLQTASASFLDWVRDNWLRKVATTGEPAWRFIDPTTKELQDLSLTLTGPQKTALLAQLDAIIAAMPTQ